MILHPLGFVGKQPRREVPLAQHIAEADGPESIESHILCLPGASSGNVAQYCSLPFLQKKNIKERYKRIVTTPLFLVGVLPF